ncbi:MAG TPA: septation ring formation regulator EzrA [Bacillota bacterium]|nr:septation ring formation regulator EzrA [Bacillota bacterium]
MLRKSLIILSTTMMLCTGVMAAPNFPAKKDSIVQDNQKIMDASQVQQLNDFVGKLPDKYKVVIVSTTDEMPTQKYTDELFDNYKMANNEILLVLNMEKEELGIHVGSVYTNKGISNEVITGEVETGFVPYAKQKSYMTGLSTVAQQLSDKVKNGNKPNTQNTTTNEKSSNTAFPTWLYILMGGIIVLLSFGVYSFVKRRKLFKEMDEIEDWMDSIEDRINLLKPDPSYEKQGKSDVVANLIEKVRKQSLPNAEASLLEAEVMCDRFRFFKVTSQLQQTKDCLAQIDSEISQLQSRMFQTKVALEECERLLDEIQKTSTIVERKLDEARFHYGVTFHDLQLQWGQIDQKQKSTVLDKVEDYTLFLPELKEMKQLLVDMLKEIDRYPQLKQEITISVPKEIRELHSGIQEMIEGGYRIPADHFEERLNELDKEIVDLQTALTVGELVGLEEKVEQVKSKVDSLYDSMEEIVTKKGMIQHYLVEIPQTLNSLIQEKQQLQADLEELALRYCVNEGVIFNYYTKLQETCQFTQDQLFLIGQLDTGNDLEYIQAADVLTTTLHEIDQLIQMREEAYLELEELRKGEYEAQETVLTLHAEIVRIEQQIRRHHLPGVPSSLIGMIEEGKNSLLGIEMALNQNPLELQRINQLVKGAKEFNILLIQHAGLIFKHCQQAEERIQQTNRYRSYWKDVNDLLNEAEKAFRELDFEKANLLAGQANELARQYLEGSNRLNFRKNKN